MKKYLSFIFCFFWLQNHAQLHEEDFRFISSTNGLSNNHVNCILQDSRGFIWIGTNDGLNRYDGKNFKVFRKGSIKEDGLSGNIVSDIVEDDQYLWIATQDGGITRYNWEAVSGAQFLHIKHDVGDSLTIPTNFTTCIEDNGKFLLVGTEGSGVLNVDKATSRVVKTFSYNAKNIIKMYRPYQNEVWVGRQGGGLLKINILDGTSSQDLIYLDFYKNLPHMVVTSFVKHNDNNLIGSWDKKIYEIDKKGNEKVFSPDNFQPDVINEFLNTKDYLWAGGDLGIQVYNHKKNKFEQILLIKNSLQSKTKNKITSLIEDRNSNIWIGTSKGILIYNPLLKKINQTFLPDGAKINIYDIHYDEDKSILIGTDNGLYKYNLYSYKFEHFPLQIDGQPLTISRIYKSNSGKYFFGTNKSLFIWSNNKISKLPGTNKDAVLDNIISSRIVDIDEATIEGHQCLIVLPYGHFLAYYNFSEKKWYSRKTENNILMKHLKPKDNLIKDVITSKETILFGSVKDGIFAYSFNNDNFNKNINSHLKNVHISEIFHTGKEYFISTYGSGIFKANHNLTICEHLELSPNLTEGLYFEYPNLWFISTGKLFKYNVEKNYVSQVDLPDKLRSGGINGKILSIKDSLLCLYGSNYFVIINKNISPITENYPMHIADIKIGNKSINIKNNLKNIFVPYYSNNIKFEFSVPNYSEENSVNYAYRINEISDEWNMIGEKNTLEFFNMNSGNYNLELKYSVEKGKWTAYKETIFFEIGLPFWKNPLFLLSCLAIIFGGLIIFFRYKINSEKSKQELRNKISKDLHDQVGSTLTSIGIFAKVAQKKVTETNIGLKDILTRIESSSQNTLSEISDIVWAINPQNDSVEGILNRMKALTLSLFHDANIKCEIKYDDSIKTLPLDMNLRKDIFLVFRELINNIMRHSACTQVHISITDLGNYLILNIEDNGKGFDPEQIKNPVSMSGNGLKNLESRVRSHNGSMTLETSPGMGTRIKMRFKFK